MNWDAWIGREQRLSDRLNPALARRWCASFDRDFPPDGVMPQGIHFCLCTPEARTADLDGDGHPRRDDSAESFLPPIPLPRRMWAGSSIAFHAPIAVDAAIERVSRIASIAEKSGGSGTLVFVEIDHDTSADDQLAVLERQTLVYRDAAAVGTRLGPPELGTDHFDPTVWDARHVLTPDPRLLLRYSALSFNTHRIHYDFPYARDVERYRGLVVHGPLTTSLLLQLAARRFGGNALASFAFRGISPAIAGEPLHLVLRENDKGIELAAFADDGRQVARAEATLA